MNKEMEYWLNGVYYKEKEVNLTMFQKSFQKEVDMPCFCYHENLSIAGNCSMCLIELKTSVKLVASCAMPLSNGMEIETNSFSVKKARESVIEFLLINHPLDCPVCDQGGECDLQEMTLVYGSDRGRYYEYSKSAVIDKEGGSLISMMMTRCIHCTSCVRFFNEVSGISILGMLNSGNSSEMSTYILNNLIDEMSGNVIDLCPVGALTSKPYSFIASPWELNFLESIDILDSVCSNISIDYLNNQVYSMLPMYNKNVNEDWITNSVRFFYDSNNFQRFLTPLVKNELGNFVVMSWLRLFYLFFVNLLKHLNVNSSILSFVGMFSDLKSVNSVKKFFNSIGSEIFYSDFINVDTDFSNNFLLNCLLMDFENSLNFVFFNLNTRVESPILNSRLRKLFLLNDSIKFYGFGVNSSYLNLPVNIYGNLMMNLYFVLKSKFMFNKVLLFNSYNFSVFNGLLKKDKFVFFFGINFFCLFFGSYLMYWFKNWMNKNFFFFVAVVFPFVGYLSFFEFNKGFNNFLLNKFNFIYLSNVDDMNFLNIFSFFNFFSVYSGNFFEKGASLSNLIIPSFSFFENDYVYLNVEGNMKKSLRVLTSTHNLILDSDLFNFLNMFKKLYVFNNFSIFKNFYLIFSNFDFFYLEFNWLDSFNKLYNFEFNLYSFFNLFVQISNLNSFVLNYYKLDVYSSNSSILQSVSFNYLIKLNVFI